MAVPKKRKYKSWKKHKLNIKFTSLKKFKIGVSTKNFSYNTNLIKLFIF